MTVDIKNVRSKYNMWQRINHAYHKNCDALLWCNLLFSQLLSAKITSHDDTAQSEFLSSRERKPGGEFYFILFLYIQFLYADLHQHAATKRCIWRSVHFSLKCFAHRVYVHMRLMKKKEEAFRINIIRIV